MLIDVFVAKDFIQQKCIYIRWLPNRHQLADFLTKAPPPLSNMQTLLRHGTLSLVPTEAPVEDEAHRLALRRGQRQWAEERKEAWQNTAG